VLDYDYYFKIVESIVQRDIKETLLLINEIIDNGFDGQHFIIGFGEHLRNLLVCKDPETLKLLEVGGNIKGKYQEQSGNTSVEFLLKALEINNKCDIDYKNSNNKNLHLELALMQMCMIEQEPFTVKSTKSLKYVEKTHASYKTAPQTSEAKVKEPAPGPVQEKKIVAKNGNLPGTISIKNSKFSEEKETNEEPEDLTNKPADDFTQEQLDKIWHLVAGKYQSDKNLYITFTRHKPTKGKDHKIEFTVDNKIQKKEIEDRFMEFIPKIKENLNNFHIQMDITVTKIESNQRPYTPQEKFNKMAEKNPALKKLKDQLGLEIDF
jgi:DNA polymerase-3 subunit gamma/tau